MKTPLSLVAVVTLISLGSLARADESKEKPAGFTAHEWGTFTAVVGSDGREVPWWTPTLEGPAALPEFVRQPANPFVGGKTGLGQAPSLIRMETPVIYFYASGPTEVRITIDTTRVRTTEVYPSTLPSTLPTALTKLNWQVQLRPPLDPLARAIPAVGQRGAHYAHARDVPDAWLVVVPQQDKTPEVEKFLFYRGTGMITMPKRVYGVSGKGPLLIPGKVPLYLVEVDESGLRWKRIDPAVEKNAGSVEIARPSLDANGANDERKLASELAAQLTSAGLTHAEASAMVNTWREAWLGEPGLRLLEILPRPWVDENLPLTISPAPSKLERVFVGRWELLTPQTETMVLNILDSAGSPESKIESLRQLDLRRFGAAAFERAALIRDTSFRAANYRLISALNAPATAATVPSP